MKDEKGKVWGALPVFEYNVLQRRTPLSFSEQSQSTTFRLYYG